MTKTLVVYESMFGNTGQIAQAVAAGLAASTEVEVVEVGHAPAEPPEDVVLVVAGGPTHAFSMSRPHTREDAVRQGAPVPSSTAVGLREWLGALPDLDGRVQLATFDTKVEKVRRLPGSAAKAAAKAGRRHGLVSAGPAESFFVLDTDGPLVDGELTRAEEWGRQLASVAAVGKSPAP